GEERAPGLAWRPPPADQVLRDRRLGDLETELAELPVNAGRPPQGVGVGHAADEGADRRGDGRATGPVAPAFPGPEEPGPGALPADDGVGLDDGVDLRPAVPQAGEQDPEHPVGAS